MSIADNKFPAISAFAALIADFVFPRLCCGCGERVLQPKALVCQSCTLRIQKMPASVCHRCGAGNLPIVQAGHCRRCVKARSGGVDQIRSAAAYTDIAVLIVAKLKFSKRTEYAPLLAAAMAETLASTGWTFDIVTWVPLHSTRQRERGFNQSQILARQIARAYPTINCTRLLKRIRPTKSQARLKRKERLTNLAGAFASAGKTPFSGKSILLIDDVCTTGSTINECARTLKSHGASTVYGLTFARADM